MQDINLDPDIRVTFNTECKDVRKLATPFALIDLDKSLANLQMSSSLCTVVADVETMSTVSESGILITFLLNIIQMK